MVAKLLQPSAIPIVTYLCAYFGTSVLGAAVLLTPFGQAQAKIFLPDFDPARMQTFGSALYLTMLFAPLLLVPAFALVGLRASDRAMRRLPQFKITDPSTGMLYALMAIFAGWCFYKLAAAGHLYPDLLFDRSKLCTDRITRRVELFTQLRYVFYAFAYAALPLVSMMFLVKGIRDRNSADLIGFGLSFIAIFYFYASIYMKAPFLTYFLILLVGLLVAGQRWWKALVLIGALAAVAFAASSMALDCTDYRDVARTLETPLSTTPASPVGTPPPATAKSPVAASPTPKTAPDFAATSPTPKEPTPAFAIFAGTLPIARNLVFRMAIAFPYYVEMFADATERCGIDGNRIPLIPKQKCFPANKVFSAMYPAVTYVQGQAPAAAHVSAVAELGPWFSLLVVIVSGVAIGMASGFARFCEPVLSAGMIAAASVFAYNLTQVPFVGALTYSQGFVVFLFPVALILATQLMGPAFSRLVLSQSEDGSRRSSPWRQRKNRSAP
jgi:hypothetical protein